MANEAVIVELLGRGGDPVRYTVANANGIEKGALLKLSDPRTASGGTISNDDPCAGIAAAEKEASDGALSIACYTNGIFDLKASGAITVGHPVGLSSTANHIRQVASSASGAAILGYALETAADAEVILVRVKL